jgi:hypothetical protein
MRTRSKCSEGEVAVITVHMLCDAIRGWQKKVTASSSVSGDTDDKIAKAPRIFMMRHLRSITVKALVDAGGHSKFIRREIFDKIKPPRKSIRQIAFSHRHRTIAATMEAAGATQTPVVCKVNGVKAICPKRFVVSSNLRSKCILGMTFRLR